MTGHRAMGAHQSAAAQTTTWLTPPPVLAALGGADSFDMDPCAAPDMPWRTARRMVCLPEDGLAIDWTGRVWCNPPYSTGEVGQWLARLAEHDHGTALIFARTETETFHRQVWERASGLLFLEGRLYFHYADGRRASANAGAPSVLCAYGAEDLERLGASDLPGAVVPLRFPRFVFVEAADSDATWRAVVMAYVERHRGAVSVSDLYRHFARHPKARRNPNWRAKVRQTLQRGPFERVARGAWRATA